MLSARIRSHSKQCLRGSGMQTHLPDAIGCGQEQKEAYSRRERRVYHILGESVCGLWEEALHTATISPVALSKQLRTDRLQACFA